MATRILECAGVQRTGDQLQIMPRVLREQAAITATATPANSAAFSSKLSCVCVQSDEAVYVAIGVNPTATTNSYRIPAGQEQFFEASKGEVVSIRT